MIACVLFLFLFSFGSMNGTTKLFGKLLSLHSKKRSAAHSLCGPSGRGPLQLASRWTTPVAASYWSTNRSRRTVSSLPTVNGFFGLLAKEHALEKCCESVGLCHVLESRR